MKLLSLCFALLFSLLLSAQEKGITPVNQPGTIKQEPKTTRAVVIGISDYQNEDIPDLRFADKDAEAFAKYLQSSAGGNLPGEHIKLLTNESATMAAVAAELDWLVEVSREGDQAIIYFSGHGDVEAKTARQPGFLLTYDSPPKIYIAGAYPLFYLQLIIETLSSDKNVQTLVITDACRAGKLAGSEIGGTQATAANLAKQYANEIKILSCQPDEFSLEGEQWGDGRGVFSYHLIEGLIGLADKNENQQVNLLELENYLETVVPEETDPQSQIPMTVGSKGTKIAFVDEGILAELKSLKEQQLPTLAAIESKGFEETLLAGVDSILQKKYEAFIAALDHDNLLDAQDGMASADELYRELIQEESLADLHRLMTRQLATALQDEAQQAINAYLLANPAELEKRWKGDATYAQYPRYLHRAADLLGEKHYMYNYLIAKQLYFEGLNLRLQGDQSTMKDSFYFEAIQKQKAALELEDRAAYFYNELGVLHTRLKLDDKAYEYYEKAIKLAPEWGLPFVNYSSGLFYTGQYEKAIEYGEKAGERLSGFPQIYSFLAWIHASKWSWQDKELWPREGIELQDNYIYDIDEMSTLVQKKQRYKKSIALLEKAIDMDPNYTAAYRYLARVFWTVENFEKAVEYQLKATELEPDNYDAFVWLGGYNVGLEKYADGEQAFLQAIKLDSTLSYIFNNLGVLYRSWGKWDKAIEVYKKANALGPTWGSYFGISHAYLYTNQIKKAEYNSLKGMPLAFLAHPDVWHPQAFFHLGGFYQKDLIRFEDMERMYQMAIEIKPDFVQAIKALVKGYVKMDQLDKIEPLLKKMELLAGENARLYIDVAEIYIQMGRKEEAINLLKIQADKNVIDSDVLAKIVRNYQLPLGAYQEAETLFFKALKLKGDTTQIYAGLGYTYLRGGDTDKAWTYFQKMINQDSSAKNHYHIASYYAFLGQDQLALEWMDASIKKERGAIDIRKIRDDEIIAKLRQTDGFDQLMRKHLPEVFEAGDQFFKNESKEPIYYLENLVQLAKFYDSQLDFERAKTLYNKALEIKPDTLSNQQAFSLAEAYMRLGRFEEAKAVCPDSLLQLEEADYREIAYLYYGLKEEAKAETYLQKYISATENKTFAYNQVGRWYKMHGDFDQSKIYLDTSRQIRKENLAPYANRAWLEYSHGNYKAAVEILDKFEELNSFDPVIASVKVLFSYFNNTPEDSYEIYKQATEWNPGFLKVWDFLELIRLEKYEEAIVSWQIIKTDVNIVLIDYFQHLYLGALVQTGKMETATKLMNEMHMYFLYYQIISAHPLLEPLRETAEYKALILRNFPERHKQ